MFNPSLLEEYYQKFRKNMHLFLPEGIMTLDIERLHELKLLNLDPTEEQTLARYFHVLETEEKITLINQDFIVWIVPENGTSAKTLVMIALNKNGIPHLELAFLTTDIYNTSKLVLRVLEKFLHDIQENEESIKPYLENRSNKQE